MFCSWKIIGKQSNLLHYLYPKRSISNIILFGEIYFNFILILERIRENPQVAFRHQQQNSNAQFTAFKQGKPKIILKVCDNNKIVIIQMFNEAL